MGTKLLSNRLRATVVVALFLATVSCLFPATASAQSDEVNTLFLIANLHTLFSADFPLDIYSVDGQTLSYTYRMHPTNRNGGPVGLAVDQAHDQLFITFEDSKKIDVVNARSADIISQITLTGTSDLAGIDVLESRNQMFVVDRAVKKVYVFDSVTFAAITNWVIPSGQGAWGIELEENIGGHDVLYVADATNVVRWYDIDTHAEVGSATFTGNAIAVAVDASGANPLIFTVAFNPGHDTDDDSDANLDFPTDHDRLQKYDTGTDTETFITLERGGTGLSVNEYDNMVYLTIGPYALRGASVRAYSTDTLAETGRYFLDSCGLILPCTPTGIVATTISYGTLLEKELTSHPSGTINPGDEVIFTVRLTNEAYAAIHKATITDHYNTQHLIYNYSDPASDDNVDDGTITWNNLVSTLGSDISPDAAIEIEMHFTAEELTCADYVTGINQVDSTNMETPTAATLPDANAEVGYVLNCGTADDDVVDDVTDDVVDDVTDDVVDDVTDDVTDDAADDVTDDGEDDDGWHDDTTDDDDDPGLTGADDTLPTEKEDEAGWPEGDVTGGCCGSC